MGVDAFFFILFFLAALGITVEIALDVVLLGILLGLF
jgi:hypothetical protein